MREAISKFADYDQSPQGLESLIHDLKREHGVIGAAQVLVVSRSTIAYWLRKLASFRTFAGQTPESILAILAEKADRDGIDEAAKLIAVDPKTLQRAIDKIPKRAA
jgi:hypothetical protein